MFPFVLLNVVIGPKSDKKKPEFVLDLADSLLLSCWCWISAEFRCADFCSRKRIKISVASCWSILC